MSHPAPGDGPFCESYFTISFFVPPDLQVCMYSRVCDASEARPACIHTCVYVCFTVLGLCGCTCAPHLPGTHAHHECRGHHLVSHHPHAQQDMPPKPTDPHVFVDASPEGSFYVSSYSGFTNEKRVTEHAFAAMEMLKRLGEEFDARTFYAAGYDSPFRLLNRHNEVWIPAL